MCVIVMYGASLGKQTWIIFTEMSSHPAAKSLSLDIMFLILSMSLCTKENIESSLYYQQFCFALSNFTELQRNIYNITGVVGISFKNKNVPSCNTLF